MTAIEEHTASTAGKSTHDGGQPTVGDATRATLPQLPYGDAVHAALAALQLLPDLMDAGVRQEPPNGKGDLFLRLEWQPGHDDLAPLASRLEGLTVQWSHRAGWSVRCGADQDPLGIDKAADPDTVAEAALHAVLCGPGCDCVKPPPGRWEHADRLLAALTAYDQHTGGVTG